VDGACVKLIVSLHRFTSRLYVCASLHQLCHSQPRTAVDTSQASLAPCNEPKNSMSQPTPRIEGLNEGEWPIESRTRRTSLDVPLRYKNAHIHRGLVCSDVPQSALQSDFDVVSSYGRERQVITVARRGEIILTRTAVSHAHQLDPETHSTIPHLPVASFLKAAVLPGSLRSLLHPYSW